MTQSIHKVVVLGLCVLVALLIASPIQAEEKVKLTGEEIKEFTKPDCITFGIDNIRNNFWIVEVLKDGTRRAYWQKMVGPKISDESRGTIKVVGDQECSQWSHWPEKCFDIYRIGKDKYQTWSGEILLHTWYRVQSKHEPAKDKVKLSGDEIKEFTKPGFINFGISHLMDTVWIAEPLEDGTRRVYWRTLADLDISGECTVKIAGGKQCSAKGSGIENFYDIYCVGKDKYQSWYGGLLWHTWYKAR